MAGGVSRSPDWSDDARAGGAQLLLGGEQRDAAGFFCAPTLLGEVPPDVRAMVEEPFGPMGLFSRFRTDE